MLMRSVSTFLETFLTLKLLLIEAHLMMYWGEKNKIENGKNFQKRNNSTISYNILLGLLFSFIIIEY